MDTENAQNTGENDITDNTSTNVASTHEIAIVPFGLPLSFGENLIALFLGCIAYSPWFLSGKGIFAESFHGIIVAIIGFVCTRVALQVQHWNSAMRVKISSDKIVFPGCVASEEGEIEILRSRISGINVNLWSGKRHKHIVSVDITEIGNDYPYSFNWGSIDCSDLSSSLTEYFEIHPVHQGCSTQNYFLIVITGVLFYALFQVYQLTRGT